MSNKERLTIATLHCNKQSNNLNQKIKITFSYSIYRLQYGSTLQCLKKKFATDL